jgi:hypothetical protein
VQLASNAALMMVASRQCLVTGRSDIPGSFFDVGPRILFVMAIFGRQIATHPMILCSLGSLAPRPRRDPLAGRSTFPVAAGLELDGAPEPAPVPPELLAAGGRKRALTQ